MEAIVPIAILALLSSGKKKAPSAQPTEPALPFFGNVGEMPPLPDDCPPCQEIPPPDKLDHFYGEAQLYIIQALEQTGGKQVPVRVQAHGKEVVFRGVPNDYPRWWTRAMFWREFEIPKNPEECCKQGEPWASLLRETEDAVMSIIPASAIPFLKAEGSKE